MPAYKNKENGTWYVMTQYTNWKGERKPKCKRGFDTKGAGVGAYFPTTKFGRFGYALFRLC